MGKITSKSWAEKDDPMFTGRFYIHSVRDKVTPIHDGYSLRNQ